MQGIAAHDKDPLLSVICKTSSRNLKMRMASSFLILPCSYHNQTTAGSYYNLLIKIRTGIKLL